MFWIFRKKKQVLAPTKIIDIRNNKEFLEWIEQGIEDLWESTGYGFNLYESDNYFWVDFWTAEYDADNEDWFAENAEYVHPIMTNKNPVESVFMHRTGKEDEWIDSVIVFAELLKKCYEDSEIFKKAAKESKIVFGHHDGDLYTLEEALENKITKEYVSV